jgi:hypothetical protein
MPIKIVALLKRTCYGCGSFCEPLYYEEDAFTPWCSECFMTPERLETVKAAMPFCQPPKKPSKIRIVPVLKKKVKCRVVPFIAFASS